jgi:hypothetical protein
MVIEPDSKVVIGLAIVSVEVDGAVTIFNPATDRYYTLAGVGATIWQLLDAGLPLVEIRARLLDRYETDEGTCERDLLALVERLREEGLVEITHSGRR